MSDSNRRSRLGSPNRQPLAKNFAEVLSQIVSATYDFLQDTIGDLGRLLKTLFAVSVLTALMSICLGRISPLCLLPLGAVFVVMHLAAQRHHARKASSTSEESAPPSVETPAAREEK